jgi:hypothetical protein
MNMAGRKINSDLNPGGDETLRQDGLSTFQKREIYSINMKWTFSCHSDERDVLAKNSEPLSTMLTAYRVPPPFP